MMTSDAPLVSVIIPNHNYARYLGQAIDSVLRQSYRPLEVVVVDDGSTDDSLAVLQPYAGDVRWLTQPCSGVSAARNRGVRESRGAFVAFLDADDYWAPTKLERQMQRFQEDAALGLMHCGLQVVTAVGHRVGSHLDGREGWLANDMLLFKRTTVLMAGSSALVPRDTFESVGGFDTRLSTSADWDLCYRIALRQRIGFVPEELVYVREHGINMHANIRLMEHDMLLGYEKAFADANEEIRGLRRRAYGNLHMVLAGCYFRAGEPQQAVRHALTSLWLAPSNLTRLLGFPVRCWRGWQQRVSCVIENARTGPSAASPTDHAFHNSPRHHR